jgi:hypothetical protein
MTEPEFWLRLEYRLCSELYALADKELTGFWCDGLRPDAFDVGSDGAFISGLVWLGRPRRKHGRGGGQEAWRFLLLAGNAVQRREDIRWADLLPADDVTGWLSMDDSNRLLTIRPLAAYPDLTPRPK